MGEDELLLNSAIECLGEQIIIVDRTGRIVMISDCFRKFLGNTDCVGQDIKTVMPDSGLPLVAKSGIKEPAGIHFVNGHKVIFEGVPLSIGGKLFGAAGKIIISDSENLDEASKNIIKLQNRNKSDFDKMGVNHSGHNFEEIISRNEKFSHVLDFAKKIAVGESSVLITGDSGTGKELMAEAIHNASRRNGRPFVKINCGAIPPELFESEMFGYDEGAFTGAKKTGMKGKFEVANGGTILLDEIGDMPLFMQVKLLRVLQEREIVRVGSNDVKKIDVRIIASTNKNLLKLIEEGKFREDLYYRLNVLHISIPPLRERKEDIEPLAESLRIKICDKYGMHCEGIDEEAFRYLESYGWPGNVRELENVVERAINLLNDQTIITKEQLPEKIIDCDKNNVSFDKKLKQVVEEAEREVIMETLNHTAGNKNETAKLLGISRQGLYKKLHLLGIDEKM